ncbi:acyl dehydratase [Cytobacillus purgationiresistens]|uniref:Acyl dehydratase n=2 Tax=Cytobacillus purgationiresistens TaxID=863449 RepID=A0ABU0AFQ7_9BACI|nr:acyl dehydratase [Cytobacillus purgationiresistens]
MLGKKRKIGRKIEEISVGEKLTFTEKIEDRDLLLYLGLTDDANPLYIQHDYASQTPHKKPIVPSIMLNGMIHAAISKYLPGPGSHVMKQEIEYMKPVHHYASVQFLLEVKRINEDDQTIEMQVHATNEAEETILLGKLIVCPPHKIAKIDGQALDNF